MNMNAERWEKINELFETALECEGNLRAAFLAEVCSGDPSLRAELDDLIASHERAGSFMEEAAFQPAMKLVAKGQLEPLVGGRIGSYEIVPDVGLGRMRAVYLTA